MNACPQIAEYKPAGSVIRLCGRHVLPREDNNHARDVQLAAASAPYGPEIHAVSPAHGWRSVLLGRNAEILLHQPGCGAFYQTGDSVSPFHRHLYWLSGNRRRTAPAFRPADAADF